MILLLLALLYPVLVFFGLKVLEPKWIALFLMAFFLLRMLLQKKRSNLSLPQPPYALALLLLIPLFLSLEVFSNRGFWFLFIPTFVNLNLLLTFAATLVKGPTMVEWFARLQVKYLSPEELLYCRRVTWVWCSFFVLNAALSLSTIFLHNMKLWTLYNGLLSYVLMGMLFAVEYVYRHYRFRRYLGAPLDFILKRFFPPPEALPCKD